MCSTVEDFRNRGLSPLARGTHSGGGQINFSTRFIPAGAGNTEAPASKTAIIAVYPRWRGEHTKSRSVSCSASGLSPLARGTPLILLTRWLGHRFIPAGAGNTGAVRNGDGSGAVYPRWRGEHAALINKGLAFAGLSPLARGTPSVESSLRRSGRFIPAGAGNTRLRSRAPTIAPVYPRWRGEHRSTSPCRESKRGLSPLARGTH